MFKWDEKSVEVHGVDDALSVSVLQLLFESRKKTGGGPIDVVDVFDGFVVVRFKHSAGARDVSVCSSISLIM